MFFAIDVLKSAYSSFYLIYLPGSVSAASDGAFNHCQSGSLCSFWKQSSQWQSPAQRIFWKCSAGQYPRLLFSVTHQGIIQQQHELMAIFCRLTTFSYWFNATSRTKSLTEQSCFYEVIVLCLYRVTSVTHQHRHPPCHLLLHLQYSTSCWMEWLLVRRCLRVRKTPNQQNQWVNNEKLGMKLMFFMILFCSCTVIGF